MPTENALSREGPRFRSGWERGIEFLDLRKADREFGVDDPVGRVVGGARRHRHSVACSGEHRAAEAAARAVESPLLETSMEGAKSILLSMTGGRDLSLWEVNDAAKAVAEAAHPDANVIFGAMVDEKLGDEVWITVVATGYGDAPAPRREEGRFSRSIEADHEPRVTRAPRQRERVTAGLDDLDVPEFMPRG